MNRDAIFSPVVALALAGVAVLSFLAFIIMQGYADQARVQDTYRPSAYSISAIGHKAFAETLRRSGWQIVISQGDSLTKSRNAGGLLLLEPQTASETTKQRLRDLLDEDGLAQRDVFLALPKRTGFPGTNPRHIAFTALLPLTSVTSIAQVIADDFCVIRPQTVPGSAPARSKKQDQEAESENDPEDEGENAPQAEQCPEVTGEEKPFESNILTGTPSLADPQLITGDGIEPVIAREDGILLGRVERSQGTIWILSDPDLFANHGLGDGDNAQLMAQILDRLAAGRSSLVIDETIHNFTASESLIRTLVEPPFLYLTLCFLIGAAALILSVSGRFGSAQQQAPALSRGHDALIDTTVSLLHAAGRDGQIVRRYLDGLLREVCDRLHAPQGLDQKALVAWVDRIGRLRGTHASFTGLTQDLSMAIRSQDGSQKSLLTVARKAQRWKQEILNET